MIHKAHGADGTPAPRNAIGGTLGRRIGLVRARARIGLKNLADKLRRLVQRERLVTAAPA